MRTKKGLWLVVVMISLALVVTGCFNDDSGSDDSGISDSKEATIAQTWNFEDDSSGWYTEQSPEVDRKYTENGKYEIAVKNSSYGAWSTAPIDQVKSEYTIKSTMSIVEGKGEGSCGLVINYKYVNENEYDLYVFKIDPASKDYKVRRDIDGSWQNEMDWQHTELINSDQNTLQATQTGDVVKLYINGTLVEEISVVEHSTGLSVGIYNGVYESGITPVRAQFDNFEVQGYAAEQTTSSMSYFSKGGSTEKLSASERDSK